MTTEPLYPEGIKASVAYKALLRIGTIYDLEGNLKDLSPEERLKERQTSIKPLVEEYFAWIKEVFRQGIVLPKSETAKGIAYSLNQEEYLKVFLSDGEVPIDDSASERALRNFTIGRKNWMTINTVRGQQGRGYLYGVLSKKTSISEMEIKRVETEIDEFKKKLETIDKETLISAAELEAVNKERQNYPNRFKDYSYNEWINRVWIAFGVMLLGVILC